MVQRTGGGRVAALAARQNLVDPAEKLLKEIDLLIIDSDTVQRARSRPESMAFTHTGVPMTSEILSARLPRASAALPIADVPR